VPVFVGADWQEREQFDLVGVRFEGHPDLRRLMMPEDWEGHPLRRDYAIDTPMRRGDERDAHDCHRPGARAATRTFDIDAYDPEADLMVMNLGPQHPVDARRVPRGPLPGRRDHREGGALPGYLHRGVEKLCEKLTYAQITPIVDKNDYVAPMLNEQAINMAFEKLLGSRCRGARATCARSSPSCSAIASHLLWLGTFALDLGGALGGGTSGVHALFPRARADPRPLRGRDGLPVPLQHAHRRRASATTSPRAGRPRSTGARCHLARIGEYETMTLDTRIFLKRTKGVGVIDGELALELG
jgi:hypothetical protein